MKKYIIPISRTNKIEISLVEFNPKTDFYLYYLSETCGVVNDTAPWELTFETIEDIYNSAKKLKEEMSAGIRARIRRKIRR